ncbi:MAG: L-serine ammonia-lyase, iron-sulfur-dependent subunit beta [Eubacteriales bacterium]|nr:L-serine ammonia-lyase, iron-sulfur-dependent subunit beta [Eubacteriales bacterium]
MNLFDILGPIMVGPSSSHTAGAVRIGYITRKLLRAEPVEITIKLHGSFAATGTGHGTDRALVAGLLGMRPDDMQIPSSLEIARSKGISVSCSTVKLRDAHPNTAMLQVKSADGRSLEVVGASLGGGRVRIESVDGLEANFSGEYPTLIVRNTDQPGHVAEVTTTLAQLKLNIATLQLYRDTRGGSAVMVIECDTPIPSQAVTWLESLPGILKVTYVNVEEA